MTRRDHGFDELDGSGEAEDGVPAEHRRDGVWGDAADGRNGHAPQGARLSSAGNGDGLAQADGDTAEIPAAEGWVVAGGVVHWEAPEDDDRRTAAESPLGADQLTLPEGAPDAPRVRAVRAWIARRRADEYEALGMLLLAEREQRARDDAQPQPRRRGSRSGEPAPTPLDLALAEHQSAADEYDALLAALEDHATHGGAGHALVEYYLWLVEHLAALAAEPEAGSAAGLPTTIAAARWRGRAQAALGVRGRVERMTAPPAEE